MNSRNIPRGIRNNNPGNLRLSKIRWQGQKQNQFDPAFVEFETPVMGLRALMKTLLTYYRRYGLDTVQSIINRWAPPHENATDYYAGHVAHRLKVRRTDAINPAHPDTLIRLAKAITVHENGWADKTLPKCWFEDDLYKAACDMALNRGEKK